jgi:hypothetical protein
MAFDVVTLSSMMNVLGRESMVENLETNFSQALQRGFAKAARGVKGLQQVFRQRRGSGGKIIGPIPSLLSPKIHRDAFWGPCLFIVLHKGEHESLCGEVRLFTVLDNNPMPRHSVSFS